MSESRIKTIKKLFLILLAIALILTSYFLFTQKSGTEELSSFQEEELSATEIEQGKINLGRKLFFDKRLSKDNTISCFSCHNPQLAFTDGKQFSEGVEGRLGFRNAPTLLNLEDATAFMFDAEIKSLEEQAIVPIQDHNEMDISVGDVVKKLSSDPDYKKKAKLLYDRDFDALVLTQALAYQKSLVSNNSLFDKFKALGDSSILTQNQLRGWALFNELRCIECHQLPNFTNYQAMNIGMYDDYGTDQGRFRVTHDTSDMGKFKTPSLRNIELTGPYMHDGSIENLRDVILLHTSTFKQHPNLDKRITDYKLSANNQESLVEFLKTLTDTSFLINNDE